MERADTDSPAMEGLALLRDVPSVVLFQLSEHHAVKQALHGRRMVSARSNVQVSSSTLRFLKKIDEMAVMKTTADAINLQGVQHEGDFERPGISKHGRDTSPGDKLIH